MTVAELVAKLLTLPQDLPVDGEGCDCESAVTGAEPFDQDAENAASPTRVLIRVQGGIYS